jgi:thiol:disulfide interchange protein DsbD
LEKEVTEWLTNTLEEAFATGSILAYFLVFAGGVVASFTPCTYPVLPLTVGFIGNMAQGSRFRGFLLSLALVFGMAMVYAVIGTVFAAVGLQFGVIWGNGWAVFSIALFFMLMSLFLMDVFNFPVPRFLNNLQAKAGGKGTGGLLGALVVGGVSGLVVGPCTGPILAIVVVAVSTTLEQAEGAAFVLQALDGGFKLFLFGFGQGALIVLAGVFAGFLSYLPKSGQWMVAVKKGFAMVILAGASLLMVYVGQATDFPELTDLLAGNKETVEQGEPGSGSGTQDGETVFSGDEFLDD